MDKAKKKKSITFRPPVWKRFFAMFGLLLMLLGVIASFSGVASFMTNFAWMNIIYIALLLIAGLIAGVLALLQGIYIFHNHLTISEAGLSWSLEGTQGLTTWDNVLGFGYVEISDYTEWNWGIRFIEPLEGEFSCAGMQRKHAVDMGAKIAKGNERMKTFLPICEVTNFHDFQTNPNNDLRRAIVLFMPSFAPEKDKRFNWDKITQTRSG